MREWEEKFRTWSKPPSEAEEARCQNTIRMVREAIARSPALTSRNVRAFVQGSYRNNTNVRRESDVDVGVATGASFFFDLPPNMTREEFGFGSADYTYEAFKREIGLALSSYFDAGSVTRGNKAFDIKASRVQVEADVAPFFEHRRYSDRERFSLGVELRPDDGQPPRIINWPEQHYENGVAKNEATSKRYKGIVRILKSLRYAMKDDGIESAEPIIGFLSECMVYNVPNDRFGRPEYLDDVKSTLAYLTYLTSTDDVAATALEVSEKKYLFHISQKWRRDQALQFVTDAWRYIGFS